MTVQRMAHWVKNRQLHASLPSLSCCKKYLLILLCIGSTLSCSSVNTLAPMEDREQPLKRFSDFHIVDKGDTLFAIAWRYEKTIDYLAQLNQLRPPFNIYRGQKLKLSGTLPAKKKKTVKRSVWEKPKVSASTKSVAKRKTSAKTKTSPQSRSNPSSNKSKKSTVTRSRQAAQSKSLAKYVNAWRWPLKGKISKPFGSKSLSKGIAIETGGKTSVRAAASGVVVYAGAGLRDYGSFVIVKHSSVFLSAYAYNRKLLVKEGDQVMIGQQLAISGLDKSKRERLYFEVRKNGKPVNPLGYLPKKQ